MCARSRSRPSSSGRSVGEFLRAASLAMCVAIALLVSGQSVTVAGGDVEQRIAEFWKRVDSMQSGDYLQATDVGLWALNVIERDPRARITVADFRDSTVGMQRGMDRAGLGPPTSTRVPAATSNVEQRIAEFWKSVDAMQLSEHLLAADLGQWALNVIERDPRARITVGDFRVSTGGMQKGMDRASQGLSTPLCGAIGLSAYTGTTPSTVIPPFEAHGPTMTVTNTSDVSNGDTSSPSNLIASPGPDGISLREAIAAANQTSGGPATIRFSRELVGASITIAAALPAIRGNGLSVSGDIDGDGKPDVSLVAQDPSLVGFEILSGANRLHALGLTGFRIGVLLSGVPGGATFANNVVSGLAMTSMRGPGINLYSAVLPAGQIGRSGNRWSGTQILGNTYQGVGAGVALLLHSSSESVLERTTIAGNTLRVDNPSRTDPSPGVTVSSGFGAGGDSNRVLDLVIAGNSISGNPGDAIRIDVGSVGASANAAQNIRVVGNRIEIASSYFDGGQQAGTSGITLITGDAGTDFISPKSPVVVPERNAISDVVVAGNVVRGSGYAGISVSGGWGGGSRNRIGRVLIEGNTLTGTVFGVQAYGVLVLGSSGKGNAGLPNVDNEISDVTIRANQIRMRADPPVGFAVWRAGVMIEVRDSQEDVLSDLHVVNNTIDADSAAVAVIAGLTVSQPATRNLIKDVEIACNSVPSARTPADAVGVAVVGGALESATSNRVAGMTVKNNLVDRNTALSVLVDYLGGRDNQVESPSQ
jgi:hypothetical protein